MKTTLQAWGLICASFVLGVIVSVSLAGCQQPDGATGDGKTASNDKQGDSTGDSAADANAKADAAANDQTDSKRDDTAKSDAGNKADTTETTDGSNNPAPVDKPSDAVAEVKPDETDEKPRDVLAAIDKNANAKIQPGDWPMFFGTPYRNNVPEATNIPTDWNIGKFDKESGTWVGQKNIKFTAQLGSQSYGNAVVADGRVYVGTNNSAGYLKRYPYTVDLGCLLCFDEQTGKLLWQHSSEKLPTGRVHDWELQGICCSPYVEGKRAWFVSSRGHVICLDTEGYYDNEDDGPVKSELARIFDVERPSEEDDPDNYTPAAAALKEGKLTDYMRSEFTRVEMPLPEEVALQADPNAKNKWTFKATVNGSEREFMIRAEGPRFAVYKVVTPDDKLEADTIWSFDMMAELTVSQHNMCSCSVTALGDILFVNTSNGVDETHINIPSPDAPSFMAMDKNTGEVLWTDKSPGTNILHGQWSSPTVAELGGVPQVLFGGGDGYLYSFKADRGEGGKPTLLWKFDCNPKTSKWILGGRGTRNNIIGTPVIYDGLVYVAVGQDPEHGEGIGHLWCIDPTKKLDGSDVSAELAVKLEDGKRVPIPHKRLQAVEEEKGELAVDNPNSAVVWHFDKADRDLNDDGRIDFEETIHRTIGTVAIRNDLLYIADYSGLFFCIDAKTGKAHWVYDMFAESWGSPLIVEDKVYIGDADGDIAIFHLSKEPHEPIAEINMDNAVYSTPIVANGVLFITNRSTLFAIHAAEAAAE